MALVERPPSEQESLSAISPTESSLSGSSEPAGYAGRSIAPASLHLYCTMLASSVIYYTGLLLDDDESDVSSSSTGDMHSIRY